LSRLGTLDKLLVLILVPLWLVCFSLTLRTQIRGGGFAMLELSIAGPDSYPVLTGGFSSIVHRSDPLAAAGLHAGDRLVRVGNADLVGVNNLAFSAYTLEEAGPDLRVPLVFERSGERRTASLSLVSVSIFGPGAASSLAFVLSALFLLFRAQPTPTVRAYFGFAMCMALATSAFLGSPLQVYATVALGTAAWSAFFPLLLNFLQNFPDDRPPAGRWNRIWPWFIAVAFGLFFALQFASVMAMRSAEIVVGVTGALGAVASVAVITRKYQRADLVARRQMKWVLFGMYCTGLCLGVAMAAPVLDPRLGWLVFISVSAAPLFPLSILISIARFNLFDIDRIISATASYNILLVAAGTGVLVAVPLVAGAASDWVGVAPETSQIVLSLIAAGVVIPAHRRLRPQIDRLFFRHRYALDQGIAELLPTLSRCGDAVSLTERLGEGLNRLLRPETCVVYARVDDCYSPVFVEGRAVPPVFAADSPLIDVLASRRTPLALDRAGRRPQEASLGPFDRAALETLGAEVVVPVCRGNVIFAFICLGPKRSGDVYTSTDLSLLGAVAETTSLQLQYFDQEDVIREGRVMQASLRRYVPGAIADQLSVGGDLETGEREVCVLFVDIRGFTRLSENRQAEEIFSTVNRYTETVSQIVQKNGGAVVEFNGDGMMAVYGAPRELAHKERAAVETGIEIVDAVGALPVDPALEGSPHLSVGVGIATGEAYVGNIQAVDRMIWTAIGNTTNLAARLQSLTRDLDATVVIDRATWQRAESAAAGFRKREGVPVRGRRETLELYVLGEGRRRLEANAHT